MNVVGIIAEYNPFHRGHEYQIQTLKERCGADYVIAAMSGNFVQRGAPALMDKFTRAKMALSCGADLVLELPALFATASAEYFARGGVSLLHNTGIVTHLGFGAETDDLQLLSQLADVLCEEPASYRECLRRELKAGNSFPAARALALTRCLPDMAGLEDLMASPNNILALEYLKALKHMHSSMIPAVIKRQGRGYHDMAITEEDRGMGFHGTAAADENCINDFCSASAIRAHLKTHRSLRNCSTQAACGAMDHSLEAQAVCSAMDSSLKVCLEKNNSCSSLKTAMPKASYEILVKYPHPFLYEEDCSALLHYELLANDAGIFAGWADSSPELARRLLAEREHFTGWSGFCQRIKTKNYTYARLSRLFTHMLLHIRQEDYRIHTAPSYLRILGFRKSAAPLLSSLKANSRLPVIANMAEAGSHLTENGSRLLEYDLRASNLYRLCLAAKGDCTLPTDYRQKIVCL